MRSPARTIGGVLGLLLVVLAVILLVRPNSGPVAATPSPEPSSVVSIRRATPGELPPIALTDLPVEARRTIALIEAGGPFPYAKDGTTFGNRERRLPPQPSGYYREYTVRTPGESDRGPRRIVTGDSDREFFYTPDHYGRFYRVQR